MLFLIVCQSSKFPINPQLNFLMTKYLFSLPGSHSRSILRWNDGLLRRIFGNGANATVSASGHSATTQFRTTGRNVRRLEHVIKKEYQSCSLCNHLSLTMYDFHNRIYFVVCWNDNLTLRWTSTCRCGRDSKLFTTLRWNGRQSECFIILYFLH